MESFNLEFLIPIALFAMITLVVYFSAKFYSEVRKAMLDKGVTINRSKKKFPLIEIGLTAAGIGIGLALAVIPQSMDISEDSQDLLIGACVLLFGGLGMLSSYFIKRRIEGNR